MSAKQQSKGRVLLKYLTSTLCIQVAVLIFVTIIAHTGLQIAYPNISGQYKLEDEHWVNFDGSVSFKSKRKVATIKFALPAETLLDSYVLRADDCLESLQINKKKITKELPYCNFKKGYLLNLRPYLTSEKNSVVVSILNRGGPGSFSLEPTGSYTTIVIALYGIIIILFLTLILFFSKKKIEAWPIWTIGAGLFIRFFYLVHTPHDVRSHDAGSHLKYIEYLTEHWQVPERTAGWIFYHPPLYHFILAPIYKIETVLNRYEVFIHKDIQLFSLLCAIGVLICSIYISHLLFSRKQIAEKIVFTSTIAFLPGIVFFSARVNNDVLVQLLSFLAIIPLLHWWKHEKGAYWLIAITIGSLAILAKTSGALLVCIALACLMFHRKVAVKQKIKMAGLGISIALIMTGWFFVQRVIIEGQNYIVGNANGNNAVLRVEQNSEHIFEFNPVRLIKKPFNETWSSSEEKSYFFEYLFRSAFFGEIKASIKKKPLLYIFASILIAVALLLLLYAVMGLHKREKSNNVRIPLLLTFAVLLAAHILLRITPPTSSPGQDFRHSTLLIVPISYFITVGIFNTKKRLVKDVGLILITAACFFSALVVILVSYR